MSQSAKYILFFLVILVLPWSLLLYSAGNKNGIKEGMVQANDVIDGTALELVQTRQICRDENVELHKQLDELNK